MKNSLIVNYKKYGIVKIPNLLTVKELITIKTFIKQIFLDFLKFKNINLTKKTLENIVVYTKNKFPKEYENITHNIIQRCPMTHKIGLSNKIFKYLKKLGLKNPIYSTDPLIMFHGNFTKNKNYAPPHQDWRSIQGSLNNLVIWIPLVKILSEMNTIEFVPKSHLLGLMNTEKHKWFRRIRNKNLSKFKKININMGDGFFFSSFLIHRSGINNSKKLRISLQYRYNDLKDTYYLKSGLPSPYDYAKPNPKLLVKKLPTSNELKKIFRP